MAASTQTIDFASFNEASKAFGFCAKGSWQYTYGDSYLNIDYAFKVRIVENPNMEKDANSPYVERSNHTRLTVYSTGMNSSELAAYTAKMIAHVGSGEVVEVVA